MIDPANLPPNLRAAMDRKPILVPPVSAGEFLRATKANPKDARNAPEITDPCLTRFIGVDRGYYRERKLANETFVVLRQYRVIGGSMGQSHTSIQIEGVPGSWNSVFFDIDIHRCPAIENNYINPKTGRAWRAAASSSPPEPVRVAREQGKPPARVLGHPDSVCFTIPGVVMGKPRMTRRDKWAKRPCVMRYRKWMDAARAFVPKLPVDPIDVSWVAYLPFPKSYSKKKREALGGRPHRKKPDRDNIDKGILDFLFKNDAVIAQGCIRKLWDDGHGPRLEITII